MWNSSTGQAWEAACAQEVFSARRPDHGNPKASDTALADISAGPRGVGGRGLAGREPHAFPHPLEARLAAGRPAGGFRHLPGACEQGGAVPEGGGAEKAGLAPLELLAIYVGW